MASSQKKKDRNEVVEQEYALLKRNIECLMEIFGEKKKDLAEAIGISASAISNYNYRQSSPDKNILFLIAEHYNVSIDDLINYDFSKENIETEAWLNEPSNRRVFYNTLFPISVTDDDLKNEKFQQALFDHLQILDELCNSEDGISYAYNNFGKCANTYKELADAGCMSARANLLWWPMIHSVVLAFFRKDVTTITALKAEGATVGDMLREAYLTKYTDLDNKFTERAEKKVRADYLDTIIKNIAFLKKSDNPVMRDLADYYMAIAYRYNVLGMGRIPRTRSRLMGEDLLYVFSIMGNQFAKDYFEILRNQDNYKATE